MTTVSMCVFRWTTLRNKKLPSFLKVLNIPYNSMEYFLVKYQNLDEDVFIIGGASIYRQFIDLATKMYLTEIDASDKDADVYFPHFNKEDWEKEELCSKQEETINYKHVLYKRKK